MNLLRSQSKRLSVNGRKPLFRCGASLAEDRGTSVLEMALLTPLLLLLLLGIIEIGRYAELSILVQNAARAGAQYAAENVVNAANGNSANVTLAAENDAQGIQSSMTVTSQSLCGCAGTVPTAGQCLMPPDCSSSGHLLVYVQVQTSGTFHSLFNYPGIPSPITVNGMAQMRVAQ